MVICFFYCIKHPNTAVTMTCVHRVLVEIEKRKKRKKEIANATWQIRTQEEISSNSSP